MATIFFDAAVPRGADPKSKVVTTTEELSIPPVVITPGLIPGFKGNQYPFADGGVALRTYNEKNQVYATSSHGEDHDLHPGLIVQPKDDGDIATAIRFANKKNIAISIKSGGHQYSGACSTNESNIMMDLSETYQSPDDLHTFQDGNKTMIKVSVSTSLAKANAFMGKAGVFVPHGQCSFVHIGGHAQTGGYGNLARGFGLFGDHVRKIRLFDHSATLKEVSLQSEHESDRNLFNAILGGSPGNFGIITHYYVEVHRNTDHEFGLTRPEFFKGAYWYSKQTLVNCLQVVADMADNPDFPHNYDLCVSVLSSTFKLPSFGGAEIVHEINNIGLEAFNMQAFGNNISLNEDPNETKDRENFARGMEAVKTGNWPAVIVVYAQWVPFTRNDKFDPRWFSYLEGLKGKIPRFFPGGIGSLRGQGSMSDLTAMWLFNFDREFKWPYEKRTYLTKSKTLGKDQWPETAAERIDVIVNMKSPDRDLYDNCYLAVQIQAYGGTTSKYNTNQKNGTSYSWRDSTVVQVLDCFYQKKSSALRWQAENDRIMKGDDSCFSKDDRRVLWGSYGDWDMKNSWQFYYENEAKYKKIGRVRAAADPKGTFTANPFAVEATTS